MLAMLHGDGNFSWTSWPLHPSTLIGCAGLLGAYYAGIEIIYGASWRELLSHHAAAFGVGAAARVAMWWFARRAAAVEFGEKNAIDVEAIGLYWHFVDIVWIIIFTAVYLLEYL